MNENVELSKAPKERKGIIKNIAIGCGALSLVMVILVLVAFAVMLYIGSNDDRISKEIAKNYAIKILTSKNYEDVKIVASSEALKIDSSDWMIVLNKYRGLGDLISVDSLIGESKTMIGVNSQSSKTAFYTGKANFQKTNSTLKISLIMESGVWKLNAISVMLPLKSMHLLENK